MDYKDLILQKIKENPKGWCTWIKGQKDIVAEIEKQNFPELPFVQKVYWYVHNLTEFPKCKTCKKDVHRFCNCQIGYAPHCGCRCAQLDKDTRAKLAATNMIKYGTDNPAKSKVVQDKMHKTCIERYGTENPFASDYGKQRIKETNLKKFGCENPQQDAKIKEKTKRTLIKKYGVTCGFHNGHFSKKSKGENELYEFVLSFRQDARHSDHKQIWPMELDIFIPSLNLGIEYDGDYWHSLPDMIERDKKKDLACKEKGISLIRIKECDWVKDNENTKQKLKETLNG